MISVWWEPRASVAPALPRRALITSAPPTPNGALHVGHLSGPYVAADVFRRYLEMRGVETYYLSGSDDHQSYVAAKGRQLGWTPQDTVNHFAESIQATLTAVDAQPDYFLRPNQTPEYQAFVQEFFARLVENGAIRSRESKALYCESCARYLYEVYVRGTCPHCQAATNGNGCEACGHVNDCVDLGNPVCNGCHSPASQRSYTRFHFALEPWREHLERYYGEVSMSAHLRALVHQALGSELPEISATHVADWGIPCPLPGSDGQVIYEWVEMAAGYLFAGGTRKERGSFWKNADAEVFQCFGFDNSFFYAAIIPALLLAYDPEIRLPRAFLSNEFYRLEGAKFSTSRNHAVWGDELLAVVPSDVVRFYLAYDRPETEQTNFTLDAMKSVVSRELVGNWEAWLVSLDEKLAMEAEGLSPEFRPANMNQTQQRFLDRLSALSGEIAEAYSPRTFSLATATHRLSALVAEAREFAKSQQSLGNVERLRPEWHNALALELAAVKTLANCVAPLMPRLAASLLTALDGNAAPVSAKTLRWENGVSLVPAGEKLGRLGAVEFSRAAGAIEQFAFQRRGGKQ